ncbi:MAG: DUF4826 family protein [Pirellulales bacterium]|nr:DUF4826 family protein [Pirellulales bacterium]
MADSDEMETVTDRDDATWIADQRKIVETYLQHQGCEHAGVSLEPRWYLYPYLALWAVRSKLNPQLVGWWAISGDVPTDYMAAARELRSIADVLAAFGRLWLQSAEAMSRGEHTGKGKPENAIEVAPLLRVRAEMMQELAEQVRAEESEE